MGGRGNLLIALLKVGRLEMKFRKMNLAALLLVVGLSAGTLSGCGKEAPAAAAADIAREAGSQAEDKQTEDRQTEDGQTEDGQTGDDPAERARAGDTGSQETGSRMDVAQDGMVPVLADAIKDGVYEIKVDSSSSMFQITECELTVRDGAMSAVMTMSGTGYLKLYMGTGADAERAPDADFIPFAENADGKHTFKVPVEALDKGIDCSAFSKKKENGMTVCWYSVPTPFRQRRLQTVGWLPRRASSWRMVPIQWQSGWRAVQAGHLWRRRRHSGLRTARLLQPLSGAVPTMII